MLMRLSKHRSIIAPIAVVILFLGLTLPLATFAGAPPENTKFKHMRVMADGDVPTPASGYGNLFYNGTVWRLKDSTGTFTDMTGTVGGATTSAEYLVGAAEGGLSAERVVTDTATVSWDLATASAAKANVVAASIGTTQLTNDGVTYAKLQNVSATNRFLGRITAGAGDAEELTGTQATTLLDPFTDVLKGLVPASGGGTTNFLRADGTWAVPAGGGGGGSPGGSDTQVQFNDGGSFGGDSGFVFDKTANALTLGVSGGTGGKLDIYGTTGPNLITITDGRIENSRSTGYFNFTNATGSLDFLHGKVVMNGTTDITSLTGGIGTSDAATNTTTDALILRHETSGTPATNFGTRLAFQAESTTTSNRDMGGLKFTWATATDATRQSSYAIQALSTTQTIVDKEGFDYTNGRFFWNVDDANPRWYMSIYDFYGALGTGSAQVSSYLPAFPAPNEGGFTWVGDTDTGMYRPAANTVGFSTAGTARWSFNASGHFVPATDATYDIGDSTHYIKDLYLLNSLYKLVATAAAGSPTVDLATGAIQEVTLSDIDGAHTITWSNLKAGAVYTITILQDATDGGETVTWDSHTKWAAGTAPTLTSAAGSRDVFTFYSDGTNLYETGRTLDVR